MESDDIREEEGRPSGKEDVAVLNRLDSVQIWLYALSESVPPGSYVLPPERISGQLGMTENDRTVVCRVFYSCVNDIGMHTKSVVSALDSLLDDGLDPEKAKLIVDLASTSANECKFDGIFDDMFNRTFMQRLEDIQSRMKKLVTDQA